MDKIELIKQCIENAKQRKSKLSKEALEVPSMTSLNIRHLLNNLGSISSNYLECGSHKGGHFCSVIFENDNLDFGIAIDNYSEFDHGGKTKEEFLENVKKFQPKTMTTCLIEEDCFTVKDLPLSKYNLYNYDAQHTESSQQRGVTHFLPNLTDEFIMYVDDWSFPGVETGTRNGIKLSGLDILFEQIFVTPEGGEPNEHWHNGAALFLLKQKQ